MGEGSIGESGNPDIHGRTELFERADVAEKRGDR